MLEIFNFSPLTDQDRQPLPAPYMAGIYADYRQTRSREVQQALLLQRIAQRQDELDLMTDGFQNNPTVGNDSQVSR